MGNYFADLDDYLEREMGYYRDPSDAEIARHIDRWQEAPK